jgi:uncharacterized membrane protein YfcA
MFVVALFLAALIGISLGLLGGGGSILTLPILKYVLGFEAHRAIASSLFVVGATSATALIPHARKGRVRWRTGIIFGLAGMAGAFGAGRVAKFIPSGILLVLFATMMVVTAVAMLRGRKSPGGGAKESGDLPVGKVLIEGLVVGSVTGLVGAGGGFLVVPALVLLGGLPMNVAVGTSLLVIAMKSFAGFAGYLSSTTVEWKTLLAISALAIVGSVIGGWAAGKVAQEKLRRGFGWFVVVMAVYMLAQELPALLHVKLATSTPWILAAIAMIVSALIETLSNRAARIVPVLEPRTDAAE